MPTAFEDAHDEADLDLGAAGVLDVERQEDEAVQAQEEVKNW